MLDTSGLRGVGLGFGEDWGFRVSCEAWGTVIGFGLLKSRVKLR